MTVGYSKPTCSGIYCDGNEVIGTWSKDETSNSCTLREAEAVKRILVSNAESFKEVEGLLRQ